MRTEDNPKKILKHIDPSIPRKEALISKHLDESTNQEVPPFSFVEFNLSGLCNRTCSFCPRSDATVFPNVNEHMPLGMYQSVLQDLKNINFCGTIIFSAFSEPLLYKDLDSAIQLASQYCPKARTELVTSGDKLTRDRIDALFDAGLSMLAVSMYDGPHQLEHFKSLQKESGLTDDQMKFRVRWLDAKEHFGLTLSNRAGSVEIKEAGMVALVEPLKMPCHYPFYQFVIDYDGAVLLCAHDWGKRLIVGNVNKDSILDIWNNEIIATVRKALINKSRAFPPCDRCDVHGQLIGREKFDEWIAYYGQQTKLEG
jgi:radical SAM protein with 4Fe4S-binding SPASM domain